MVVCEGNIFVYFLTQVWKTLKTAETSLMDMINQKDYDVSAKFQDDNQPPKSPHEYVKKRSDRLETEAYYIIVSHRLLVTFLPSKDSLLFYGSFYFDFL